LLREEQTSKICCSSLLQPELGASSDFGVGGGSILWREEDADRWAWFLRKIFIFFKGTAHFGRSANVRC